MIAGCFVAGGAESFVSQHVGCSDGGFVAVDIEYLGSVFLVGFSNCHPSPLCALPHSCKWGNAVPIGISLVTCLGITMAWGIAATWGSSSVLILGAGVPAGVGGIGQSFLVSNRFSDVDPQLGQGVLCLGGALGTSSSDGGLDPSYWGLAVGCGTSANCPIANLYTVTSIDSAADLTVGVWVLTVATVGGRCG